MTTGFKIVDLTISWAAKIAAYSGLIVVGLFAIYFWLAMVGVGFWLSLMAPDYQFDTTPSTIERAGYFILSVVFLLAPILAILSDRRKD